MDSTDGSKNQIIPHLIGLPPDVVEYMHTYIDDEDWFNLRLVDTAWHRYITQDKKEYKQKLYDQLAEELPKLKVPTGEVPKCLDDFKIYWHARYGTFFLAEKITERDRRTLEEIKNLGTREAYIAPPFKKAHMYNQKGLISSWGDQLRNDTFLPTYQCPLFDHQNGSITWYTNSNLHVFRSICNAKLHIFEEIAIHIDCDNDKHYAPLIAQQYPRLFNQFLFATFKECKPDLRKYHINDLVIEGKPVDKKYKKILQKYLRNYINDSSDEHYWTEKRILQYLFLIHTGDGRRSDIEGYIKRLYTIRKLDNNQITFIEYYAKIKEKLFKDPVHMQKEHIDDFDLFKKKLIGLEFDQSKKLVHISDQVKEKPSKIFVSKQKELLNMGQPADIFTLSNDTMHVIHSYLDNDSLYNLYATNKNWWQDKTHKKTYKEEQYSIIKKELLPIKKSINDFKIYWHGRLGTLFLQEKLTEHDIAILQNIKEHNESGNESMPPSPPKKYVCAVNQGRFIQEKIEVKNVRILDNKEQSLLYTSPFFDQKTNQIIWCEPYRYLKAIVYIPRIHMFREPTLDIRAVEYGFLINKGMQYYPRLFCAYINKHLDNSYFAYEIHSINTIDEKPINEQYKKTLRHNFELSSEPKDITKKDDLLTRLFMLHSGDNRSSNINNYIRLYYYTQWPWYKRLWNSVCSEKEYNTQVQDRFYKTPITQQKEHIDDFDVFKKELIDLSYKASSDTTVPLSYIQRLKNNIKNCYILNPLGSFFCIINSLWKYLFTH
jgi:hypothetical protein